MKRQSASLKAAALQLIFPFFYFFQYLANGLLQRGIFHWLSSGYKRRCCNKCLKFSSKGGIFGARIIVWNIDQFILSCIMLRKKIPSVKRIVNDSCPIQNFGAVIMNTLGVKFKIRSYPPNGCCESSCPAK